jgi:CxC2 like cysteine cluster associated with KDZ transposases
MWNGKYYSKTTLYDQGYILHLGHQGRTCPVQEKPCEWVDVERDTPDSEDIDVSEDPEGEKPEDIREDGESKGTRKHGKPRDISKNVTVTVNIVHTTGVFKHKIRWCHCQSAAKKPVQLFQMRLFSASYSRPETAFTFDVLDHFHIDAMECKTAASSFMKKLCRLTNNAFPRVVPVSAIVSRFL